ncbi:O-acyltransferase like protein-like [Zerene cesonia]|uniref:O-acyltransferase like protein-like n=1 Tax=Zerene cesonia TaxID=33412 RepID=UPI0018E4EC41|nr:O-acyltransferase like protein-like [Zerene cesonia]
MLWVLMPKDPSKACDICQPALGQCGGIWPVPSWEARVQGKQECMNDDGVCWLVFFKEIGTCLKDELGQLIALEQLPTAPFDQDLYESVLDSELCAEQMARLVWREPLTLLQFLDAGFRIPSGLLGGNAHHLGNYFQCLDIYKEIEGRPSIRGKYSYIAVPLEQSFQLPFIGEIDGLQLLENELRTRNQNPDQTTRLLDEIDIGIILDLAASVYLKFGLCIPASCTAQEWMTHIFFNITMLGFNFEEEFVRLPNDKPWVAADWVAVGVFGAIAVLTIISTSYDLHSTFTLKKEPKQINQLYSSFSVYTNARRLTTFSKSSNALECLDGIRSISMIWVILGHAFTTFNHFVNLLYILEFLTSSSAAWISTGVFAVDTFFLMTGLLLVYTSMGRMKSMQLLKGLHMFYIQRILRLFPLLAAIIILEASFFHRMTDGPFWMSVATNTDRCRNNWWSTLLYIQNYVHPIETCIEHSWYLAIDMQLHIISPLVLFWVLSGKRKLAWTGLLGGLLIILTASTIFNFIMDMPPTNASIIRVGQMDYYMTNYYKNTLTRASPFFYGMILGYVLHRLKGRKVNIRWYVAVLLWIISLGIFTTIFYLSYAVLQLDWDNQLFDNFFNSFSRTFWSFALSWLIFACVHGYGGPINWFLSLPMWKLPSRISYAMYLYHYSFMFIYAGTKTTPIFFSPGQGLFNTIAFISLSFLISFAVTVLIDAPFSTLTKLAIGGGVKKSPPAPVIEPEPKKDPECQPESTNGTKAEEKSNL